MKKEKRTKIVVGWGLCYTNVAYLARLVNLLSALAKPLLLLGLPAAMSYPYFSVNFLFVIRYVWATACPNWACSRWQLSSFHPFSDTTRSVSLSKTSYPAKSQIVPPCSGIIIIYSPSETPNFNCRISYSTHSTASPLSRSSPFLFHRHSKPWYRALGFLHVFVTVPFKIMRWISNSFL